MISGAFFSRTGDILRVVARHRLDTLLSPARLDAMDAPWWLRLLVRLNPLRLRAADARSEGERLRAALTDLGPVYIKLGQMLSTRPDIVPPEVASALASLQDTVPPIPTQAAMDIVEQELEAPISRCFTRFDHDPLAAASIAQVHTAQLPQGDEVVVKVVRPGLRQQIASDMAFFRRLAASVNRRFREARRLKLAEVLDDYEQTICAELDMLAEAANTARLRANFAGSDLLYVPRVYQTLCRSNVLVLERIHGVSVSQVQTMQDNGVDLALLAERGVTTFFTQVFEDNFFHADMHPGNVFVDISDPADPSYIALDCAIMGSLTERDQEYLARNLLAFFKRDYAEVARLHISSGWVPADTDTGAFERVIREVCEPIFAKPLAEISFGNFLLQLFETAEQFQMEVQPQLVLLQKTLLYIEGLGRALYPQLDLWATAQPFMERWLVQRVGPAAQIRRLAERTPQFLETLPALPDELLHMRAAQQRQAQDIAILSEQLEAQSTRIRRNRWLLVVLSVLAGSAILVAL